MGLLVDGVWQEDVSRTTNGRFIRPNTAYHNFITPDGGPGPNGINDWVRSRRTNRDSAISVAGQSQSARKCAQTHLKMGKTENP